MVEYVGAMILQLRVLLLTLILSIGYFISTEKVADNNRISPRFKSCVLLVAFGLISVTYAIDCYEEVQKDHAGERTAKIWHALKVIPIEITGRN